MYVITKSGAFAAVKVISQTALVVAFLVGASSVVAAVSPQPDLTPNFPLELVSQQLDVTNAPSDQMLPSTISRDTALGTAQTFLGTSGVPFKIFRARSRRFMASEERDVWLVVFQGGSAFFGGPDRPGTMPEVIKLTGLIIDAQTGDILRGFMEGP
jgi:hypothetical protein